MSHRGARQTGRSGVAKDGRSKGESKGRSRVTRAVAAFDPIPSRRAEDAVAIEVDRHDPGRCDRHRRADVLRRRRPGPGPARSSHAGGLRLRRGAWPDPGAAAGRRPDRSSRPAWAREPASTWRRSAMPPPPSRWRRSATNDLVVDLTGVDLVDAATAGQAVVEGVLLARYRYRVFRDIPNEAHLRGLTIVTERGHVRAVRTRRGSRRDPGPSRQPRPRPGQYARRPT